MYVTRVPNRGSPPAVLLRESYRDGGKVKTRTLANLSRWPDHKVDKLQRALKGLPPALDLSEAFEITRSLPHGHAAAVLGTARRLGLEELIDPAPSRQRDLVLAMLVAQVIDPGSKLAFARGLRTQTATSSLGQLLGVSGCDEDDLYAAMDWVLARKDTIESSLAAQHLVNGTLVLYDVPTAASSKTGSGSPGCVWSGIGACSPTRASATRCAPRSWTGSARCAPRRSRRWSRRARCSCRCSMSKTCSRSVPRSFPANGWCAATTPCWPNSGPANVRSCWRPPKKNSPPSRRPPAASGARCAGGTRSRCGWARSSTPTRWPNTSPSPSPRTRSPSPPTTTRSPPRPPSTASTCYAPACPPTPSAPTMWCCATRDSKTSSGSFAPSTASSTCGPSAIGWPTGSAPTCSYACCPTTWSGTSNKPWPQSCSSTTTNPPRPPNAPTPSPQPNAPIKHWPRPRANAPPRTPRCTASPACSPTWPPSAPTRFNPTTTCRRSPSPPAPPPYNEQPSNCSVCHTATAWRSQDNHPATPQNPRSTPQPVNTTGGTSG